MAKTTSAQMLDTLPTYADVRAVRIWEGRRIYIETTSSNGGKKWNGGLGYRSLYIDLTGSDRLVARGEAGAATRNALRPTLERIADDFGLTLIVNK